MIGDAGGHFAVARLGRGDIDRPHSNSIGVAAHQRFGVAAFARARTTKHQRKCWEKARLGGLNRIIHRQPSSLRPRSRC